MTGRIPLIPPHPHRLNLPRGNQILIAEKQLFGYEYYGFWRSMDNLKDKITFDELYAKGEAPWEVWKK